MLISHRKRFIYTKTVKTAGTSVESYFEPYCMRDGEWTFSHGRDESISEAGIVGIRSGEPLEIQSVVWWNHMPAQTIRALIGETIWNDYFKFCIVRNPFDAVVSAYRFFWEEHQPKESRPAGYFTRIRSALSRQDKLAELRGRFEHWLRSIRLPIDRNKYCIDGRLCVDHVIRYENLNNGIREVCRKVGIEYRPEQLPYLKKSESREFSLESYYSPAALDLVERAYEFELNTFSYGKPWETAAARRAA